MEIKLYINYDLGIRGDYKGLYRWLDKNKAEERGNAYALIKKYDFPDSELTGVTGFKEKNLKFIKFIKDDILKFATIGKSDRIYMTFNTIEIRNLGGVFLFGRNQASPWEGYYQEDSDSDINIDF